MPAPANDDFANALNIGSASSGSQSAITIDSATTEVSEPVGSNVGSINKTIWYKWTCPVGFTGTIIFDTLGSPTSDPSSQGPDGFLDTTMGIWTGSSLATLSEITSDDDNPTNHSTYTSLCTFTPTPGVVYFIQVGVYDSSYLGQVILNWYLGPVVPSNDDFANATLITSETLSESIDLTLATVESGEPVGSAVGLQIATTWYKIVPPLTGPCLFWAPNYFITIWQGSSLVTLTQATDVNGDPSSFSQIGWFVLQAGQTYYVQLATNTPVASTFTFTNGANVTPSLDVVESPTLPYLVFGDPTIPVIAVRAADFVASARAGLSVVADASSNCGNVVRETQQIARIVSGGFPDLKAMFLNAQDTIVIPHGSIPLPTHLKSDSVSVYVRYKLTFSPDNTNPDLEGLFKIGVSSGIGSMFGASANPGITNEFSQPEKLPFWNLQGTYPNENLLTVEANSSDLIIRAFCVTTSDAVWEIDQIFILPFGSLIQQNGIADDLNYTKIDEISFFEDLQPATGFNSAGEYKRASDYSAAPIAATEIGNFNWENPSYGFAIGVGPIWNYDYSNFFHDDFNRTVVNGWGLKGGYKWSVPTFFTNHFQVSPGVAFIYVGPTYNDAFWPAWLVADTRTRDWNSAHGTIIDASVGWDAPINSFYYVACVGWKSASGVGSADTDFIGVAIIYDSGSYYAAIVQYNSWSVGPDLAGTPTNWLELSSRVSISGSQPLQVHVERLNGHIKAIVEGHTIEGDMAVVFASGGSPFPTRSWWVYPFTTSLPPGFIISTRPMQDAQECIAQRFENLHTFCYDFKISLENYGSQPVEGHFSIERQDGLAGPAQVTIPFGTLHILSMGNNYFGNASSINELFWRTKQWLVPGVADSARMSVNSFLFTKSTQPAVLSALSSIFWFYRNGQWHQQNVDTAHSLYIYAGGQWRSVRTDPAFKLKGRLTAQWQN